MEEKQAIDLLWEEWKYRHDLFWKLLFRWASSVITLWVIPFLKPDIFKPLPQISLAFPILAFAFSILSAVHLAGELKRFEMINRKYKAMWSGDLRTDWPRKSLFDKLLSISIGRFILYFYSVVFPSLSIAVGYLLLKMVEPSSLLPL